MTSGPAAWTWQVICFGPHGLGAADLGALFVHFLLLSLLAIGGAISTAPDMHRYLVGERGWLGDAQFSGSIALAQAAPGPNVLFVAVLGYNAAGLAGVLSTMGGCLLPSTLIAVGAARWGHQHRESRAVKAFNAGLAPLTIGLLLSSGWVLAGPSMQHVPALLLVLLTMAVSARTRISPLWLIGLGALLGAAGWV